jgi:phosphate acetyltransferase
MHILETLKQRAIAIGGTIVLPEANDRRTLEAAANICAQKIAKVILLGNPDKVLADAAKWNYDLAACEIIDPIASA